MHNGETLVHSGFTLMHVGFTLVHIGFTLVQIGFALAHIGDKPLYVGLALAHIDGIIGSTAAICGIICGITGDILGGTICGIIEQGDMEFICGKNCGHGHGLRGIGPGPADKTGSEPAVDSGMNCCWPTELTKGSWVLTTGVLNGGTTCGSGG